MNRHALRLLAIGCALTAIRSPADVLTDWNTALLQTFAAIGQDATPPTNTRALAMMSAAVFDAVNSVNHNYEAYLSYYTVTGPASMEAAAAQAAHDVLANLYSAYPSQVAIYDSLLTSQLNSIANGADETNGILLGQLAAAGMLTARANDGWNASNTYSPQPLGTPGAWQPGSSQGAWGAGQGTFLMSEWAYVTPFTMSSGDQFRLMIGAPPALASQAYADALNEVQSIGSATSLTRTADQTNIGYHWMDGPGTESPPGHWNYIAQDVSSSLSFEEKARLFALLNLAEADAAIAIWDAKRLYDFWRPMQAIGLADTDGNPLTNVDTAWTPLIPTPSFPSYTSGHSGFSAVGAEILASFLGTDNVTFTSTSHSPFLDPSNNQRNYTSFSQAADDAGMSRIYGGIHYSFDNAEGQALGESVANHVFNNFLQPVPESGSAILLAVSLLAMSRRRRTK